MFRGEKVATKIVKIAQLLSLNGKQFRVKKERESYFSFKILQLN